MLTLQIKPEGQGGKNLVLQLLHGSLLIQEKNELTQLIIASSALCIKRQFHLLLSLYSKDSAVMRNFRPVMLEFNTIIKNNTSCQQMSFFCTFLMSYKPHVKNVDLQSILNL